MVRDAMNVAQLHYSGSSILRAQNQIPFPLNMFSRVNFLQKMFATICHTRYDSAKNKKPPILWLSVSSAFNA